MNLENQILLNQYGQGLITSEPLMELFDTVQKREFLNELIYLIIQSKPKEEDIESAIEKSALRASFTPCVLLRKGIAQHHLRKIVELPDDELGKSYLLLLNLFRLAYKRRFDLEKDNKDKWWYWDLSDRKKLEYLLTKFQ